jgi:hypothetical protein
MARRPGPIRRGPDSRAYESGGFPAVCTFNENVVFIDPKELSIPHANCSQLAFNAKRKDLSCNLDAVLVKAAMKVHHLNSFRCPSRKPD